MNKPYFNNDSTILYLGDCLKVLKKIEDKSIDVIFADPPYFLSSGGVSCHSGKQVSVDKADWDKSITIKEKNKFNKKWFSVVRLPPRYFYFLNFQTKRICSE